MHGTNTGCGGHVNRLRLLFLDDPFMCECAHSRLATGEHPAQERSALVLCEPSRLTATGVDVASFVWLLFADDSYQ
jgi:hypothetical protein